MKKAIKFLSFIVVFCFLFLFCSQILMLKDIEEPNNYSVKVQGLKNEEPDSFDVMFFGTSHVFGGVNPLVIFKNSGITSYIYSSPGQHISLSYHFMVEAFKTQKPTVVFFDIYALLNYTDDYEVDSADAHRAIDNTNLSFNKIKMITDSVEPGSRAEYYLPMIAYHNRWSEIGIQDFDISYKSQTDFTKGYRILIKEKEVERNDNYSDSPSIELESVNLSYLDKMVNLSKENNCELILCLIPCLLEESDIGRLQSVKEYAATNNIIFIDYNSPDATVPLDSKTDFYDFRHLNYHGAQKISTEIADFLSNRFQFEDKRMDASISSAWESDYQKYLKSISQ